MFKLAGGDYYHVPATQVQHICPGLQTTIEKAVRDGTVSIHPSWTLVASKDTWLTSVIQAMTDVFEVPPSLEQDWKDWWTINDYIAQGKSHTFNPNKIVQYSWNGELVDWRGETDQAPRAGQRTTIQASKHHITKGYPLTSQTPKQQAASSPPTSPYPPS